MTGSRLPEPLRELAELCGVAIEYRDWQGERREASPDVLVRVLAELGAPIERPDEAEAALAAERRRRWAETVAPCAVARGGQPAALELRVPEAHTGPYRVALVLESGTRRRLSGRVEDLPVRRTARLPGGDRAVLRALALPALEYGYHRADVEVAGERWEALVISAPERAYQGVGRDRTWGVFAPTYALHTRTSLGAGSLRELAHLSQWVAEQGGDIVGTLPLTAGFYDEPFEPSPYSPVSRLFWNELFVDVDELARVHDCDEGREALASEALASEAAALRAEPLVDYRRQMALVRPVLEAFSRSAWRDPRAREELEQFVRDRPRVDDYARFRAVACRRRCTWTGWPEPQRAGTLRAGDYDEDDRRYHVFCQYVLSRQLSAFKERQGRAGLYLDLPVGVSKGSYDVWSDRESFAPGCSVGAPPDALFQGGQNWALPPLHPERIRRRGYRYVVDSVKAQLEHAAVLRIDHVMALHRLFWIPDGVGATEGVYVRYPHEELYAILVLESHRQRCALVGEDLGTVPPEVPRAMERAGMLRLHVAQFGLPGQEGEAPERPERSAVASFGTHDTPTFAGFWEGDDIDRRVEIGLIDERDAKAERAGRRSVRRALGAFLGRRGYANRPGASGALCGLTGYLAASGARVALVTLEDLWLEPAPQNIPGTSQEYPNWRRKMSRELDRVTADPDVQDALHDVDRRRGPVTYP